MRQTSLAIAIIYEARNRGGQRHELRNSAGSSDDAASGGRIDVMLDPCPIFPQPPQRTPSSPAPPNNILTAADNGPITCLQRSFIPSRPFMGGMVGSVSADGRAPLGHHVTSPKSKSGQPASNATIQGPHVSVREGQSFPKRWVIVAAAMHFRWRLGDWRTSDADPDKYNCRVSRF
jgi:hypothetical protein